VRYTVIIGFREPQINKLGQGNFGMCNKVTGVVDGVISEAFHTFLCEVVFGLPLEDLHFEDEDSWRMMGATRILFVAINEGALHPILGPGHQMRYLIGRLLLLMVGGIESMSYRRKQG